MKKFLSILFFSFITHFSYGQQTFTQTFVDRCTGEVQIVTANFVQGSAVVAFYDEVRLFTYTQFLNGQLQTWLIQKYEWWQALSPCSQATQQVQQAQQTAQAASQAASVATNTTTNATSNTTSGGTTTESTNTDTSTSTESSSTESSSGNGEGESGGGEETSSETSESESEGGEAESESEESSEESSEKDGDDKEEGEGGDDDEDSDDGKKSEKKKQKMMPIQLKADMMGQQSLLGTYNSVLNFGASQSSIFGDVNYAANLMVWDNLKQAGLSLNRTKVTLNDNYQAKWVDATSVSYMRNYRMNAVSISLSRMKPMGRWGTVGVGVNYSNLFGKDNFGEKMPKMYSMGWNVLYANSFQISPKINYSPAIIGAQNPLTIVNPIEEDFTTVSRDFIGILSNSFTIQLTRRFSFNVGWTLIYSTNEFIPIMNSFMIGSKLPF